MTHTKEEVLKALAYLENFSEKTEYKNNLSIIYNYFSDLVTLVEQSQKQKEAATNILFTILNKKEGNT